MRGASFSPLLAILALVPAGCRQIADIQDIELESDAAETDGQGDGASTTCACTGCTVLATGQDLPLSLQIQGDTLYWLNYGSANEASSLMSMPTSGGTPKALASNLTHAYGLQKDATHLYWGAGDRAGAGVLEKMPLGGGAVVTLVSGENVPDSVLMNRRGPQAPSELFLATTAADLYFVGFDASGNTSSVKSVPLGGGAAKDFFSTLPEEDAGSSEVAADGILVSGSALLVLVNTSNVDAIYEVAFDQTSIKQVVSDVTDPLAMTLSGADILWCDDEQFHTNGFVRIAPLAGGLSKTLGSGLAGPWGIVADESFAYWIDNNFGSASAIQKAPLDASSAALTLVSNAASPQALVIDASSVYWVDSTCGGVLKAPK